MEARIQKPNPELLLGAGFGLVPIVAGADKFTNLLVDWEKYLSPMAKKVLPFRGRTFMKIAGVVEIAVGLGILFKPTRRIASYVASAWLAAISANLLSMGDYFDVAARDALLSIAALALAGLQPEQRAVDAERILPRIAREGLPSTRPTQPAPELRH